MKKALVILGGGGMKGLAHIGALKALHEANIQIVAYGGTSIGSIIAVLAAAGQTPDQLQQTAIELKRRDILDFNLLGLFLRRFRARGMYRGEAFYRWLGRILPDDVRTFRDLQLPCFVNAVNLRTGANTIFGLPGLDGDDVPLRDAIYASASIPGIFRPRRFRGEVYIDGAVVDSLQTRLAKFLDVDLIVAVNLANYAHLTTFEVERKGFMSIVQQAFHITTQFVMDANLALPTHVPRLVINPDVSHHRMFGFDNTMALIAEGERAAREALEHAPKLFRKSWLPFVQRRNALAIDEAKCTQCGNCVINDMHGVFRGKMGGKITVDRSKRHPLPLMAINSCPFNAIYIDAGSSAASTAASTASPVQAGAEPAYAHVAQDTDSGRFVASSPSSAELAPFKEGKKRSNRQRRADGKTAELTAPAPGPVSESAMPGAPSTPPADERVETDALPGESSTPSETALNVLRAEHDPPTAIT